MSYFRSKIMMLISEYIRHVTEIKGRISKAKLYNIPNTVQNKDDRQTRQTVNFDNLLLLRLWHQM